MEPNLYNKRVGTEIYFFKRENVDKTLKELKYGCHNQIQVWESVMRAESISTSHICCTQREPFSQLYEYEC